LPPQSGSLAAKTASEAVMGPLDGKAAPAASLATIRGNPRVFPARPCRRACELWKIRAQFAGNTVLEGSVQRGGSRMRVNVQLIDAETGNHLWAERFDKPLADLFDMQDEIVARRANALNTELVVAEARRAEQAATPDSMDLYFQGMAWLNKGHTPDHVAQARSFFDRALAADPSNVDALVGSARTDVVAGANLFVADCMAVFAAAEAKLTKPCRRSRTMRAAICTWG